MPDAPNYPQYLGDGVYASFDGYQIWLAANHHTNLMIALEPAVLYALADYVKYIKSQLEKDRDNGEG